MSSPTLAVEGLTVEFQTYRGKRRALDEISLSIEPGEIVGIVGESGCGKSILAYAILGLITAPGRVTSGRILFHGQDLGALDEAGWHRLRGKSVGLLVSNARSRLNPLLGIGKQIENVVREADPSLSKVALRERSIEILRKVGIPDAEQRFNALPHEFSGGMCQRVVIAMSIVNSPELLIADEPTSGLDVTVQRQILDLVKGLVTRAGSSVLVMTRDPGVVAHYCQRAAVMRNGRIVEIGGVSEFFRRPKTEYSRQLLLKAVAAQAGTARGLKTVTGQ